MAVSKKKTGKKTVKPGSNVNSSKVKQVTHISTELKREMTVYQKNEITEYTIYMRLAAVQSDPSNKDVLMQIANDEKKHYEFWKQYTRVEVPPDRFKIFIYYWIARILGLTFGIKLMERGEQQAQENYTSISYVIPAAQKVSDDEEDHEKMLLDLIQEERLNYVGSIVLGLNDALVELTGALAGLTFALQNTDLVALAGLITGISASFSMAASEYLSTRANEEMAEALKSSFYTGIAYIVTVAFLITPYFIFSNPYVCLTFTILTALMIILVFNFYISVARDYSFKKRFFEMAALSVGVAVLSFGIGSLARFFLGVDV